MNKVDFVIENRRIFKIKNLVIHESTDHEGIVYTPMIGKFNTGQIVMLIVDWIGMNIGENDVCYDACSAMYSYQQILMTINLPPNHPNRIYLPHIT